MTIATCPRCSNTGAVGERCCPSGEIRPPEYRCARCHVPMHALQGCYPAPEGHICHACHTKPPEPRHLTLGRPGNPEVN